MRLCQLLISSMYDPSDGNEYHGAAILAMLGPWDGAATYSAARGWTFGPVRVCFSGQTERDLAPE